MPLSRLIWITAAAWLAMHAVVCALVYNLEPTMYPYPEGNFFNFWDSTHYTSIVVDGYDGHLWAFYPLYPLVVKTLLPITGLQEQPDIGGALFSTLFFAAFCGTVAWLVPQQDSRLRHLVPQTIGGWLLLLSSPASYIFHTNHTESLFLCLSFGAFWASQCGRWKSAALLAGLSALTRNQGVLLAVAVALDGALQRPRLRDGFLVFFATGLISGLFFCCYPLYQHVQAGDALTFIRVQATNWTMASSLREAVGTLWYANEYQIVNLREHLHLVLFFIQCGAAVCFLVRRDFPLAFYVFSSTIIVLMQGHLGSMFRFGSVLFPVWFLLGDEIMRLPKPARWAILIAAIAYNIDYTRAYAQGGWAY